MLPNNQDNNAQLKIAQKALEDFVLDVEPVSNQVVVKTTTAAAQVIAESIDNLYIGCKAQLGSKRMRFVKRWTSSLKKRTKIAFWTHADAQ